MAHTYTKACRDVRLPPTQKAVLMCLADFCHDDGKDWHSVPAIMAWTCLGRTAVLEAIGALEAAGLIKVDRRRGLGSTIWLQADAIEEACHPSATRTSPPRGPVRQPDHTSPPREPPPVRHADHTSPPRGHEASIASEKHQKAPARAHRRTAKTTLPENFGVSDRVKAWAAEHGFERLAEHLESFRLKAASKGYTYVDWDAAFMGAVREDWAGLRGGGGRNRPAGVAADERPTWLRDTGFQSVYEAESAGCGAGNAHKFRNRERVEA